MKRRTLLRTVGAGVVGTGSGCLGGGGEAVVSINRSVTVEPGRGWITEIPDVSDPGGELMYVVRSEQRAFDVYFFTSEEQVGHYDAYISGEEPAETPRGHDSFSRAAVPTDESGDLYEAATRNGGARESLDATGPYYFVVDHSNYRMENRVEEYDDPLSVFVDLEVIHGKIGF